MATVTADLPVETDPQAVVTRFATTATSPDISPVSAVSPDRSAADPGPDPSSKIFNKDSNTTIAATTEEVVSEVATVEVSAVATEVDSAVVTVGSVEVATSVAVTTAEVAQVSADLPAPAADLPPASSAREEAPVAATLAESELN